MQCAAISRSWLILVEFYQNHSFQPREHAHLVQKTCSTSQTNKNHWNPRPIISLTERARRPISMPYTTFNIREGAVLRRHEIVHQACHFLFFVPTESSHQCCLQSAPNRAHHTQTAREWRVERVHTSVIKQWAEGTTTCAQHVSNANGLRPA